MKNQNKLKNHTSWSFENKANWLMLMQFEEKTPLFFAKRNNGKLLVETISAFSVIDENHLKLIPKDNKKDIQIYVLDESNPVASSGRSFILLNKKDLEYLKNKLVFLKVPAL